MTPLFYDDGTSGHHPGYIAGIVKASQMAGLDFLVASVDRPASLQADERWIPLANHRLRDVMANRRQIASTAKLARQRGADLLVDLYLDKQVWAADAAKALPRQVHVLHHAEQYDPSRSGFAGLRTRYLLGKIGRMTRAGDIVVVHNPRTADLLRDAVLSPNLRVAGYPVEVLPSAGRRRPIESNVPVLLFVGAGRREKGLDILLSALTRDPDRATIRIVGKQPPGLRDSLTERFPTVNAWWEDRFVDPSDLHEAYLTSHLAVLPYRSEFGLHGGPSSVLLETLSSGIPVVTTTALAWQLPDGYEGATVAEADSPESLADAVARALGQLGDMSAAAAVQGPQFVTTAHSYSRYLETILEKAPPS